MTDPLIEIQQLAEEICHLHGSISSDAIRLTNIAAEFAARCVRWSDARAEALKLVSDVASITMELDSAEIGEIRDVSGSEYDAEQCLPGDDD